MSQYMKQVFILLFQRLTSMKTAKYVKGLLVYFGIFIYKYGAPNFIQMIDGVQPQMFGMVLDRLFISETQKVTGQSEKKILAVGITKLLCEAPQTNTGEYANYWLAFHFQFQLNSPGQFALFPPWFANIHGFFIFLGHPYSKR